MKDEVKIPTSSAIVKYLIGLGHTQQELADILGVARSFISHVANGRRNLTLDHLETLAAGFHTTLPDLYLKAVPLSAVPQSLRPGYALYLKAMKTAAQTRSVVRKPRREAAG